MKQPGLGIAATILIMAIALGFVSLFSFPTFAGWVGYLLLCTIPLQIVMIVTWGTAQPAFAGNAAQPVKGILLTLICVVVGLGIAEPDRRLQRSRHSRAGRRSPRKASC